MGKFVSSAWISDKLKTTFLRKAIDSRKKQQQIVSLVKACFSQSINVFALKRNTFHLLRILWQMPCDAKH